MKHCEKSYSCPYGMLFFEENLCAYRANLNEYDICPFLLENWDYIIDELVTKEREGDTDAE